jgi:hypothetical protein
LAAQTCQRVGRHAGSIARSGDTIAMQTDGRGGPGPRFSPLCSQQGGHNPCSGGTTSTLETLRSSQQITLEMFPLENSRIFSQNESMATPFTPTRQDVERYRRLRAVSIELSQRLIKTIPSHAFGEVGDAIGILRNGVLVFDSEDMSCVMGDCCFYDWFENGKNLVQRYAETHPAAPGTDESFLLNAYTQAKYRVLMGQGAVPDAGIRCRDAMSGEELFVMDLGLSRSPRSGEAVFATRTIPLGEYWMTSGAGLPINSKEAIQHALSRTDRGKHKLLEGPGSLPLLIVRALLADGAADYVAYETVEAQSRTHRREPRFPGFKRRRQPI